MIPGFVLGIIAGLLSSAATVPLRTTSTPTTGTGLISKLSYIAGDPSFAGNNTSSAASAIVSSLPVEDRKSTAAESVESAWPLIEGIFTHDVTGIVDAAKDIALSGLIPPNIISLLNGYDGSLLNSGSNQNPRPSNSMYPSKGSGDAPYSVREDALRGAIYIPESFSYGKGGRKPVILVPGTAIPAGISYHFSFSKLGDGSSADVVWVNIPRASLSDAQVNAEYVAYAINYISAISGGGSVAVLTWSQGGLDAQWALKYWPSTRGVVEDFIAISPDFHGTIERAPICPTLDYLACTPSIWQQGWETNYIKTLRDEGGDSAYVPTTTVYSSFDEIVEPMSGRDASAILQDAREVGVTNNHLQSICPGQPAGGIYSHEGVLYNPIAWALAIDALDHDGPGETSRLHLDELCQQILPPQLGLDDMLGTEGLLLIAVAEIVEYRPRATSEPAIQKYARGN